MGPVKEIACDGTQRSASASSSIVFKNQAAWFLKTMDEESLEDVRTSLDWGAQVLSLGVAEVDNAARPPPSLVGGDKFGPNKVRLAGESGRRFVLMRKEGPEVLKLCLRCSISFHACILFRADTKKKCTCEQCDTTKSIGFQVKAARFSRAAPVRAGRMNFWLLALSTKVARPPRQRKKTSNTDKKQHLLNVLAYAVSNHG